MAAPPYYTPDQQTAWSRVWNISRDWGRKAGPPPLQSAGLANTTGVICYQNSVLQCILHAPQFINWLEEHHVNEDQQIECHIPDCIACSLRNISTSYWKNDRFDFEINQAVRTYRQRHRQAGWQVSGQQDAHELYEHLITQIREQCVNEDALLRALLTMETISTLTCTGCSRVSRTSAVDNCMVCPFERSSSLVDLIRKVFETESIPGFRCEGCGNSDDRERHHTINVPPEILVIQLNRFAYNPKTQGTKKKSNIITFPASLDLSGYCAGERKFTYGLFAVIKHFGNINTGHYIVYTKGPGRQWEEINDTEVTPCTIEEALNPRGSFLPYLIFYMKEYQSDNSVAESPVSFPFTSSEESSSEQSPAKRVSHQISDRIIQLHDSDEETAPEIPSTLPSTSQLPPVSEPSLPKTSTPRRSPRAQNPNPLSTPAIINHTLDLLTSSVPASEHLPTSSPIQPSSRSKQESSPYQPSPRTRAKQEYTIPSSQTPTTPPEVILEQPVRRGSKLEHIPLYEPPQPNPNQTHQSPIDLDQIPQYHPPSPTPPRSKKLPKYMVPEQPQRIQPHRTCRNPRQKEKQEEKIQGPVRVQPIRSCRVTKNTKQEPKPKAKARKGKQARQNKKR